MLLGENFGSLAKERIEEVALTKTLQGFHKSHPSKI